MTKVAENKLGQKGLPSGQAAPLNPTQIMQEMLKENMKKLKAVLGDNASSFMVSAINLYDRDLAGAEQQSVMNALFIAAALKLPIEKNMGFAYIIPYKNNKNNVTTAQFQIGYKGLIQLALRSGGVKKINAIEIYEGQIKSFNRLTEEIELDMTIPNKGDVVGYAAYLELTNGFNKTLYVSKEDMEAHANEYSQAYRADKSYKKSSSVWTTGFDSMAKKTILKMILRFAPLSTDMQMIEKIDQTSIKKADIEIDEKGKGNLIQGTLEAEYVDNQKDTSKVEKEQVLELLAFANTVSYDINKTAKDNGIDINNMTQSEFDILQNILDEIVSERMGDKNEK